MADGWRTIPLGQLASIIDGPHATPTKVGEGPWYLSISSLNRGRLDLAKSAHLSQTDYERWARRAAPRLGDTLFSYETRIGEAAHWDYSVEAVLGRRMALLRPDDSLVEPRFLTYAFLGPQFQDVLRAKTVHGATVDRLLISEMGDWPLSLPGLPKQKAIADLLGALDDLIDANRRLGESLVGLAQSAFNSRFECSGDASDRGWPHLSFASTVSILGGGTPRTSNEAYWGGEIPWYSVVDAPSESDAWCLGTAKSITPAGMASCSTRLLPVGTTIISARGTVGKLALVGVPMTMNQSCYALVGPEDVSVFTYFSTRRVVAQLQQMSHGSVFNTITRDTLASVQVPVPPDHEVHEFEALARPLMAQVRELILERNELTWARDELLPLLMSGRIVPGEVVQ